MYIEKRVPNLHSANGWEIVKNKFLTYFNPLGGTKERQIKAWKEMTWKPEKEKLTDFVFGFSQLAQQLGYSDEQQMSHFVLCIPKGLYLYLRGAQTIPDAVENLRRGIALGGLDLFNSNPTDSKPTLSFMTLKENKTDTLRAVKESIQDSMYDNNRMIGGIIDEIRDRLANVIETSSRDRDKDRDRDRDRDRSPSRSRSRNNLRDNYRNTSSSRDRYDSKDNNRDRDRGKPSSKNERNGRRKHQKSRTGQRNCDNNEFCNFCDIAGHTTHRCYKLTDYLSSKGKKIIPYDEKRGRSSRA